MPLAWLRTVPISTRPWLKLDSTTFFRAPLLLTGGGGSVALFSRLAEPYWSTGAGP